MRSPVRGQSPSDGEKVSDNTPLLQDAPQAEAGERRSDPGSSGGRRSWGGGFRSTRALCGWVQSRLGRGSSGAEPGRQGDRKSATSPCGLMMPRSRSGTPGASEDREGRPGRWLGWDLGKCSLAGPGRGAAGRRRH